MGKENLFASDLKIYLNRIKEYPIEIKLVFFVVFCSFLSGYFAIPAFICSSIYLIYAKKALKKAFISSNVLISLLLIYTFAVSLVKLNFIGALASIALFLGFVILFSARNYMNVKIFEDLITLFIAYSIFAGIYAIIELPIGLISDSRYRCASTFVNPLYYCYFVSFVVLFCVYRLIITKKTMIKYAPILILNLVGLLISGSKMPWIGIFLGVLVVMVMFGKWKWLLSLFTLCLLGGVGIGIIMLFNDGKSIWDIFNMNSISDSITQHESYWKYGLRGILENPVLGKGFLSVLNDTYWAAVDKGVSADLLNWAEASSLLKKAGVKIHSHNIIIEALYSMGVVGSLVAALYFIRRVFNMLRKCDFDTRNPMIILLIGCLIFIAVDGIVDCQFIGGQTSIFTLMFFTITSVFGEAETYRIGRQN